MKIIIAIALMAGVFSCFAQEEMVLWSFETKGKITSHPIIDGNQIFFGSQDSTFYSLDIISGDQIWSYKTKASIQSKALINNEIVYLKSGNDVYALNKNNGQEIWSSISKDETGAMQTDPWDYHSGAPAIYKSNIYFGLGNGKVKGFDLETGESE